MTTGEPKQKKDLQLADVLHFLALLLVILVCVFPFYWMVTSSFKQQSAILASTPQFFSNRHWKTMSMPFPSSTS